MTLSPSILHEAYTRMLAAHGHQAWWPGDTPFEVCVGAILTQNTAWTNVEKAIARLKEAGVLDARAMFRLPEGRLAELIRPAGYFNIKARRLRSFLQVLLEDCQGNLAHLFAGDTPTVRQRLLAIPGVGPETADSMLLYAGGHLSFVVDAYTRRIFSRHGWCAADVTYEDLQALCATTTSGPGTDGQLDYWQDYHAQLVRVGKEYCRPREPRCDHCPLRPLLPSDDAGRRPRHDSAPRKSGSTG